MDEKIRQKAVEIIGQMECGKGFECAKGGFEHLCKVKDFGLDGYVECLEDHFPPCEFALPFGYVYFCKCPLRVFLAKKLRK